MGSFPSKWSRGPRVLKISRPPERRVTSGVPKVFLRIARKLLVTTVTEVSPPFLGVPQIWRSRSGYKSIAVSFAITGSSFALACLPRRREQVRGIPSYRPAEYVVNLQRVAPLRPFGTSAAPPRRSLGAFDRFLRPNSPFFSGPPHQKKTCA